MIISFTNVIGSIRNVGKSIITSGLKMWLGFKTSEISGANQITPDLSGNSNVGQLFTGKALDFNGSTDTCNITGFQLTGSSATVSFWINPSASNKYILDVRNSATNDRLLIQYTSANILKLTTANNVAGVTFGAITSNQWQRVVLVINGTSADAYVDGVQSGTTQTVPVIDISSANRAAIGSVWTLGTSGSLDGKLSDFQIYNAVWSADDIAYDYAKPNHVVTDNPSTSIIVSYLKGYWALSEGAGSIAYDSSGGGINGVLSGATYTEHEPKILQLGMVDYSISTPVSDEVTLVANPSNPSQDILGNSVRLREHSFNLGLVKTGSGTGHAEVVKGSDFNFGTGDFTLEAWVKFKFSNTNSTVNAILGLGEQLGGSTTAGLTTSSNNRFNFVCGTLAVNSSAGLVLTEGDWYHVVGVRENSTVTLYVDAVNKNNGTSTANVTNTDNIKVGQDTNTGRYYKELISDCRIYERALSEDEIINNYNAGLPAHSAGSSFSDDFSSDYGN